MIQNLLMCCCVCNIQMFRIVCGIKFVTLTNSGRKELQLMVSGLFWGGNKMRGGVALL
jgi:hypothetical protein